MTDRAHGWLLLSGVICAIAVAGGIWRSESGPSTFDRAVARIKADEGFRPVPYQDTRGHLTVGYGTRLDEPMAEFDASALLEARLARLWSELVQRQAFLKDAPPDAQVAIMGMVYQLGPSGVLEFHDMLAAMKRGDYESAANAVLNSRWFEETPQRALSTAHLLASL